MIPRRILFRLRPNQIYLKFKKWHSPFPTPSKWFGSGVGWINSCKTLQLYIVEPKSRKSVSNSLALSRAEGFFSSCRWQIWFVEEGLHRRVQLELQDVQREKRSHELCWDLCGALLPGSRTACSFSRAASGLHQRGQKIELVIRNKLPKPPILLVLSLAQNAENAWDPSCAL